MIELWGIMGELWGIMNLGCHFVCCWLLFVVVVWPLALMDMSDFRPHSYVLYVRLSYLYKAPKYSTIASHQDSTTTRQESKATHREPTPTHQESTPRHNSPIIPP